MKVWELEEGKEYVSNALCDLETTKYKIIDGELYYSNPTINYGKYRESGMEYNRASYLDFTLYTPPTDWSKVEVDTKVLVSKDGSNWYNRHFAKYENGEIYAWCDGRTSFTYNSEEECDYDEEDAMISWNYAKLYKQ